MAQLKILVVHGPNLNLLGTREPEIYGRESLDDINESLRSLAKELKVKLDTFQSNHEGEIVDKIQGAKGNFDAIIINPAAYTHTSVAILDALKAVEIPVFEVHLSNIHTREPFRHHSYVSSLSRGIIMGFGSMGYRMALSACVELLSGGK